MRVPRFSIYCPRAQNVFALRFRLNAQTNETKWKALERYTIDFGRTVDVKIFVAQFMKAEDKQTQQFVQSSSSVSQQSSVIAHDTQFIRIDWIRFSSRFTWIWEFSFSNSFCPTKLLFSLSLSHTHMLSLTFSRLIYSACCSTDSTAHCTDTWNAQNRKVYFLWGCQLVVVCVDAHINVIISKATAHLLCNLIWIPNHSRWIDAADGSMHLSANVILHDFHRSERD